MGFVRNQDALLEYIPSKAKYIFIFEDETGRLRGEGDRPIDAIINAVKDKEASDRVSAYK
jgi:hypothetical protein